MAISSFHTIEHDFQLLKIKLEAQTTRNRNKSLADPGGYDALGDIHGFCTSDSS